MKLIFIIENNEPHATGGGFYAIFKFAEFLAKRGHSILIYAVHDFKWISETPNLTIYYRPKIRHRNKLLRKLDKCLDKACDYFILNQLIDDFSPDWILGVLKESAIKAVKQGQRVKCPVANFIYECPPWLREIYGQAIYDQGNQPYIRKLWQKTQRAYQQSTLLFPNSELSKHYNQAWLGIDTINDPIHPGIDPEQMPFSTPHYTHQNKSVLFVGRLVRDKNVHHLIDAWQQMPHDIHLHIVGDGPDKQRLKAQSAGHTHVTFHGFIADDALWELFKTCTMLVCPSNFEGFGMPPMQALYFAKPCLVSDIPIFHSIYGDYVDYFEIGNIAQLLENIQKITSNPGYCQVKGELGRSYILKNFTWEVAAKNIETALVSHGQIQRK